MKKAIVWVAISTLTLVSCGDAGVGAITGLIDDNYDFEYVITEIRPSSTGRGSFVVKNNNTEYAGGIMRLSAYRTMRNEEDPYLIEYPGAVSRTDFYTMAQIPVPENRSVSLDVSSGLEMSEGANMEFYYSVAIYVGNSMPWIGTRKVSYASCAEDAGYQEGVVCKLREQVGGTLYYDAYVNGVLARGGDDEDVGCDFENVDAGVVGLGGDDRVTDDIGDGGVEFGGGAVLAVVGGDNGDSSEAVGENELVGAVLGTTQTRVVRADDGEELAGTSKIETTVAGELWLIWLPASLLAGWLLILFWRRRKQDKKNSKPGKRARMVVWKH